MNLGDTYDASIHSFIPPADAEHPWWVSHHLALGPAIWPIIIYPGLDHIHWQVTMVNILYPCHPPPSNLNLDNIFLMHNFPTQIRYYVHSEFTRASVALHRIEKIIWHFYLMYEWDPILHCYLFLSSFRFYKTQKALQGKERQWKDCGFENVAMWLCEVVWWTVVSVSAFSSPVHVLWKAITGIIRQNKGLFFSHPIVQVCGWCSTAQPGGCVKETFPCGLLGGWDIRDQSSTTPVAACTGNITLGENTQWGSFRLRQ